jgi:SAM-dependent methyltransferase
MPHDDPGRLNAATFARAAAHYAAVRPGYPPALVEQLAALAPARDLAWDCGTGNGQLALALAEHFARVVATDVSPEQLAQAPAHARVDYRVMAAEDAVLPRGRVALLTVAQAVHWFDVGRFWPRALDALGDGGVCAVIGYGGFDASPYTEPLRSSGVLERIAPYWAAGNRMVWDGYRALPFPFDEIDMPRFELQVSWTLERFMAYTASWSAWQRYVAAHGDDLSEPLRAAALPAWGDAARPLAATLALRVGRKRAG